MTRPVRLPRSGFTLVELMIALVLGLLLLLGISGAYLAQRQTYRLTENLARMQDNARVAFELMAREIREAGGTPCGRGGFFTNQIIAGDPASTWLKWPGEHGIDEGGLVGYGGGDGLPADVDAARRVAGTDALVVRTTSLYDALIYGAHDAAAHRFSTTGAHGFKAGDVLMACDHKRAMLFEVAAVTENTVGYAAAVDLGPVFDGAYEDGLDDGGFLGRLSATAWFIGDDGRGGRSLYRIVGGGAAQEIAEGVSDMRLAYLTRAGADPAETYRSVAQLRANAGATEIWTNGPQGRLVTAVRVELSLSSRDRIGTDGNRLEHTLTQLVSLRHRERLEE